MYQSMHTSITVPCKKLFGMARIRHAIFESNITYENVKITNGSYPLEGPLDHPLESKTNNTKVTISMLTVRLKTKEEKELSHSTNQTSFNAQNQKIQKPFFPTKTNCCCSLFFPSPLFCPLLLCLPSQPLQNSSSFHFIAQRSLVKDLPLAL